MTTSMTNIAKPKTSPGLDSTGDDMMISGASHLTIPGAGLVAVRLTLELMGASP